MQDRQTELSSLLNARETLARLQQQHRMWCRDNETLLEEERERLKKIKLQVDELHRDQRKRGETMEAISDAKMMARAERDDARAQHKLASETVRNLEEQLGVKDGRLADMERNLADMQKKYEFVNQEYHNLRDRAPSSTLNIV